MDSATVQEAAEAPPAVVAPPAAIAQDSSSKTEKQICISTGMSYGIVSLHYAHPSGNLMSNSPAIRTLYLGTKWTMYYES